MKERMGGKEKGKKKVNKKQMIFLAIVCYSAKCKKYVYCH